MHRAAIVVIRGFMSRHGRGMRGVVGLRWIECWEGERWGGGNIVRASGRGKGKGWVDRVVGTGVVGEDEGGWVAMFCND